MIRDTVLTDSEKGKNCNYIDKWANYLCFLGDTAEYNQIKEESKNAVFAVMQYRKLLKSRGLGNIPYTTLNTAYSQQDYSRFIELLQQMFLEIIDNNQFDYILEIINRTDNGLQKLYNKHLDNQDLRLLSIVKIL